MIKLFRVIWENEVFRYSILLIILFISISLMMLLNVINKESNPFFYANF